MAFPVARCGLSPGCAAAPGPGIPGCSGGRSRAHRDASRGAGGRTCLNPLVANPAGKAGAGTYWRATSPRTPEKDAREQRWGSGAGRLRPAPGRHRDPGRRPGTRSGYPGVRPRAAHAAQAPAGAAAGRPAHLGRHGPPAARQLPGPDLAAGTLLTMFTARHVVPGTQKTTSAPRLRGPVRRWGRSAACCPTPVSSSSAVASPGGCATSALRPGTGPGPVPVWSGGPGAGRAGGGRGQ